MIFLTRLMIKVKTSEESLLEEKEKEKKRKGKSLEKDFKNFLWMNKKEALKLCHRSITGSLKNLHPILDHRGKGTKKKIVLLWKMMKIFNQKVLQSKFLYDDIHRVSS